MATQGQVSTSFLDTPLWQAIAAMRIEPEGAALGYAARLGRKQGWGKRYTYAVIEEYRRFLYLATTGERPITPSEDVDEAWHLHLTYTRHYWEDLCGRILGRPLHHDPTEGGAAQQAHFKDQYAATLARYEVVFGEPPRPDVWPPPAARFAPQRRPLWPRFSAAIAASSAVTACTALSANSRDGGLFIYGAVAVAAAVGLVMFLAWMAPGDAADILRRGDRGSGCGGGGGGGLYFGDGGGCGDGGSGCGGGGCGGGCGGCGG